MAHAKEGALPGRSAWRDAAKAGSANASVPLRGAPAPACRCMEAPLAATRRISGGKARMGAAAPVSRAGAGASAAALCMSSTEGRGGRARRVLGEGSRGARVKLARIDGARGMGGRIEYNVPRDPRGGMQLVNYGFALNDLLAGEELTAPVQALRCDGHQHMGAYPRAPHSRPPSSRCPRGAARWLRFGGAAQRRAVGLRCGGRRARGRESQGPPRPPSSWVHSARVAAGVPACRRRKPGAVPRCLRSQCRRRCCGPRRAPGAGPARHVPQPAVPRSLRTASACTWYPTPDASLNRRRVPGAVRRPDQRAGVRVVPRGRRGRADGGPRAAGRVR